MGKALYRPRLINTALIICGSFALYGMLIDLPLILPELQNWYIFGRILAALVCFGFLIQVNIFKRQFEAQVPIIYLTIILYCIHGQYFVNGYYLAFMQAIAGFSLFFAMPKKYFYPITFFGNVGMLVAIWSGIYPYSEIASKAVKFNVDTSLGITLISIICFIGYITITLAREKKHALSEKFLDVGRYFGNLVHELKGVVSSPTVYAELLSLELNKQSPDMVLIREIVENLKSDVMTINQKILNINTLSKNSDEITKIDINELIQTLKQHFFSKSKMEIEVLGKPAVITGNEFSVRSILLNLMSNSKENFSIKGVSSKYIQIIVEPTKITYRDNGGGFSPAALKEINRNSFFTDKVHGSGMGIFTIKEYMKEFNGNALFNNRGDGVAGVEIELVFPREVKK